MKRRAFLQLFAAAGVAALAPQAFQVAEFVYAPESEIAKLRRDIRAQTIAGRLPDAIRLPAVMWDKLSAELEPLMRYTNTRLADQGIENLMVHGVPIIRD